MIIITSEQLQVIYDHAVSTYPDECCGILLGEISNHPKKAVKIITTKNAWGVETAPDFPGDSRDYSRRRSYTIAPQDMLRAQKQARDESLSIISIFHSHPDNPAIPSEFDREYAWQEYSYIIVSVQEGKVTDIKSWYLDNNHQFQEEEIEVLPHRPHNSVL